MKAFFKIDHPIPAGVLAELCGGTLRDETLADIMVDGVCTDSRESDRMTAFAAMRGERVDGHDYIASAIKCGCRCFICERSCEEIETAGAAAIVVGDTELALSRLANAYKERQHCKKIAVTGSVGKTTTKDMIASVLSVRENVFKTEGNHNSVIGMPLSMLEIPGDATWSVLEMGMSGFGEIERMSITAEPDIAVITNIGTAHLEMLGSRRNICRAKLEILSGLKDGGYLLLNGDEPLLADIHGKSYHTVYVSTKRKDADFLAQNIRVDTDKTLFDLWMNGEVYEDFQVNIMGAHFVYAALYAVAVGTLAGLSPNEIREGLLNFRPAGMRQNIYTLGKYTVIEDCYNASPESMASAIDILSEYTRRVGGRSIAVLGDMLELGEESPSLHRAVGAHLSECNIERLYTVGHEGAQIAVGARQRGMSASLITGNPDRDDVAATGNALLEDLREGDVILFKASRAVGAERIISYLRERI